MDSVLSSAVPNDFDDPFEALEFFDKHLQVSEEEKKSHDSHTQSETSMDFRGSVFSTNSSTQNERVIKYNKIVVSVPPFAIDVCVYV